MKCDYCGRKCGLMTFKCKCNKYTTLCIKCFAPEDHKCDYDYLKDQKEKIKRENQVIQAEKIKKI